MCNMTLDTRIEKISSIKKNDDALVPKNKKSPSKNNDDTMFRTNRSKSIKKKGDTMRSKSSGGSGSHPSPAFEGSKFDTAGYCLKHPNCKLAKQVKDDATGKLTYQELKSTCPSCPSSKKKSARKTSLGGGKVRSGHRVHGAPSSRSRSKSRERGSEQRGRDDKNQLSRNSSTRSRSKSKSRREYSTPFDSKGRCHHHKSVQLAAKKLTGGWKVLHSSCPRCMEAKFEEDGDDDRSVRSISSRKSTRSVVSAACGGENANGKFDKNGCCVIHTHVQVAKKRVFGTGFKVVRICPACDGNDIDEDNMSVSSKRSSSSRKSSRSIKSSTSRSKPGKATKSGRYGALPFDGDGYCCHHPSVQIAQKKTFGGFKIIHNVCPECKFDDGGSCRSGSGRRKPSRRKSGTGRVFDDTGSETSSFKSGKSSKGSSSGRKRRIRVRNLKTEDEEGKHGRYSGDVNDDHQPHGNGVMKYTNGTVYDGVWRDGSKVHGKTKGREDRKSNV